MKKSNDDTKGICGCLTFFAVGGVGCYIADSSSGFMGNLIGLIGIIGIVCIGYIVVKYIEKM